MSLPKNRIDPDFGFTVPRIILNNVDLPAPFGPIIQRSSFVFTEKFTLSIAFTPPKKQDKLLIVSIEWFKNYFKIFLFD